MHDVANSTPIRALSSALVLPSCSSVCGGGGVWVSEGCVIVDVGGWVVGGGWWVVVVCALIAMLIGETIAIPMA